MFTTVPCSYVGGRLCNYMEFTRLLQPYTQLCTEQDVNKIGIFHMDVL